VTGVISCLQIRTENVLPDSVSGPIYEPSRKRRERSLHSQGPAEDLLPIECSLNNSYETMFASLFKQARIHYVANQVPQV